MFAYIQGTLTEISPHHVVVETSGLGYLIFVPLSTFGHLPAIGEQALLYTTLIVREDSHRLFGFHSKVERSLFNKLIELSKMGPKTSLALLGHLNPEQLQSCIAKGQVASLAKVPGIGKKTAERLIIELRDYFERASLRIQETVQDHIYSDHSQDAINALINLGYSKNKAEQAVAKVQQKESQLHDTAELIKMALRMI